MARRPRLRRHSPGPDPPAPSPRPRSSSSSQTGPSDGLSPHQTAELTSHEARLQCEIQAFALTDRLRAKSTLRIVVRFSSLSGLPPDPESSAALIEVIGLHKRFGPVEAVRGIDLQIDAGECFGLIGPNGAGKTTTLKSMATLVKPDRGRVRLDGLDAARESRKVRKVVGYMPDIFQSYGDLKVIHYLDYYASMVGLTRSERVRQVEEVLELVDLQPKRDALVGGLSRGVKQRLCLAKTLLHDPKVLLLDEPASGLDPRARIEIRLLLKVLRAEMGKTIVISSHILEDLEEICDRVAVIEAGQVVATGSIAGLKAQASRSLRYQLEPYGDPVKIAAALSEEQDIVASAEADGRFVRIVPTDALEHEGQLLERILAREIRLRGFREEAPDLHEVFLELTSGQVS